MAVGELAIIVSPWTSRFGSSRTAVADRGLQGWYEDTFRLHEARYFSGGRPTNLVRDGDNESYDEPPSGTSGNLLAVLTATQDQEPPGWPGQQPPIWLPDGDYWPDLGAHQHGQAPPPRRHRTGNILLGSIAGLAVLLVGVGIWGAASSASEPAPAPTVTVTAAAAPAATVTVTAAAAPAATVTVTATAAPAAAVTVTLTAQPTATGAGQPSASSGVLINFSGNGPGNSAPFIVNSSAVAARYSYDCSGFGATGNFIADMVSGSPSSGSYDNQSIANELGSGGSQTTTVYPQIQGGSYHLDVNSECSWSITLTAG
jgi:hypothetical protein